MKAYSILTVFTALMVSAAMPVKARTAEVSAIEVSGTATVNIIPDRITIEIGMEEYYRRAADGDSAIVRLSAIERNVRNTLKEAGVSDSLIVVSDFGNYRNRNVAQSFLMAKRLSAVVSDFSQIDRISDRLDRDGIISFNITKIDNTEIEQYNREGLKAALDAAREKAVFIAENAGVTIIAPCEIVENGPNYYETPSFSNVAVDSGSGMENMRRIVRRYSVRVKYLFKNSTGRYSGVK